VAQLLATPVTTSIRVLPGAAASSATQARGSPRATTHRPFAAASVQCNQLPGCCSETRMCWLFDHRLQQALTIAGTGAQ
jgi:hypothetical protein